MIPACGPVDHLDFGSGALSDLKFAKRKNNLYQKICSPPQLVERFGETQLLNPKKIVVYTKMP